MKYNIMILLLLLACKSNPTITNADIPYSMGNLTDEDFEVELPNGEVHYCMVLFGGYSEKTKDIRRNFPIIKAAKEQGIAVVLMSFNQRLWLEEEEKEKLENKLTHIFNQYQLPKDRLVLGGFSSGGNVALLLGSYLALDDTGLSPIGIFTIDNPVDLLALYQCSRRNIERNFSPVSVRESSRTVENFDTIFGDPAVTITMYTELSPYLFSQQNISNLESLKDVAIRLYTEPDTIWWKEQRQNNYEDMNAFYLKELSIVLKDSLNFTIELIETKDKGYRSNGYRHPHSWSIVDQEALIDWITHL